MGVLLGFWCFERCARVYRRPLDHPNTALERIQIQEYMPADIVCAACALFVRDLPPCGDRARRVTLGAKETNSPYALMARCGECAREVLRLHVSPGHLVMEGNV